MTGRVAKEQQLLYGLLWPPDKPRIEIVKYLIRKGGQWTQGDRTFGAPLFDLYREMQTLVWGNRCEHNDWTDLILKSILEERVTCVQAAKDSSKTHMMARYALTDYFCFPQETLILMSSTDLRGLELRVYGEIKDLFNAAKEQWPEAPGFPLDSMHGIFTDELKEGDEARDIRKGIVAIPVLDSSGQWRGMAKWVGVKQKRRRVLADECFPAGTLVDTPEGTKPIERLMVGERVLNACGTGQINGISFRYAQSLVRIKTCDNRQIVCTPNHRILTQLGWVKAVDISSCHYILSPYEALSIMRETYQKQVILQSNMSGQRRKKAEKHMPGLRETMPKARNGVVRSCLFAAMASGTDVEIGSPYLDDQSTCQKPGLEKAAVSTDEKSQSGAYSWGFGKDTIPTSNETSRGSGKTISHDETKRMEMAAEIPTFYGSYQSRNCTVKSIGRRSTMELYRPDKNETRHRLSLPLQNRCGYTGVETGSGSRRIISSPGKRMDRRPEERRIAEGSWVDRCEILKQRDFEQYSGGKKEVEVFNLHVENHHSYSVNGLVVSNCQFYPAPYLSTLANLNKGDFKFVGVGNPIGEGDPLDRIAEPKDGWDSLPEITTTTTWRNKMGGVTIQLYGPDSPAIRNPGRFTYLINQGDIDRIVEFWGKDSLEYWNQGVGVRKPGINARRVVTRDMAAKFGAQLDPIWKESVRTKLYAIDASYGGDRCVGGPAEFGLSVEGTQILAFGRPTIIPIRMYPKSTPQEERLSPEDQIAEFVKADCERLGIPAANVFHDATGRGSLGTAFARIWSADTNPIDFGGNPTSRPVSNDLYIYDEELRTKRLKRCDEHYSKFVSELWFSVRYIIEGRQCRSLPNEALDELCAREWMRVRGYKIEVEPKEETKLRLGWSPDMGDWSVICGEGARRLGFKIARLESPDSPTAKNDHKWKRDLQNRAKALRESFTLLPT